MREQEPPDGTGLQGLVSGRIPKEMTEQEREAAITKGASFAEVIANFSPGPCLVITGEFVPPGYPVRTAEAQVLECCVDAFGYQDKPAPASVQRRINVLLDSPGGSLDSAFKIVRYLTWYAGELNVYVPRRAKSASTLLALGAHRIYMSPFGELGPLDAQILDPRNPATFVSALDCYQSVDYVCKFGVNTMSQALSRLGEEAGRASAFGDVLRAASSFGVGAIQPMLDRIIALDFGAWGRSLEIGEKYARQILKDNKSMLKASEMPDPGIGKSRADGAMDRAAEVARRLVYEYPHHLYFMDYREVTDIGLKAEIMSKDAYQAAMPVVEISEGKSFIEFVSHEERDERRKKRQERLREAPSPYGSSPASLDASESSVTPNTSHAGADGDR